MKLGDLEFYLLTDGYFCLDGGAMFGVIPRPLWERKAPPDERNRIRLAMNSLLIRQADAVALVRGRLRSEEHTSELQSLAYLVCRLLLEKKKKKMTNNTLY